MTAEKGMEIKMAQTVRMSDIGEALGVSTVTVSKALSGQKGVSEELRARIKELAEEMGYKKRPASREESGKSYNIGVLVAEIYVEKYATFYWEMYQAVNARAAKANCFVLLEILAAEDENELTPPMLLKEEKVDGMLVLGAVQNKYLRMMEEFGVPLVFMDFYDTALQEDSVISNSFYGTYALTNYLMDMGHTEIGFVGTAFTTVSITDRYYGYLKSMEEHGLPVRKEWIVPDRDQRRRCYEEIELPEKLPTAFVCNCDFTAGKVIKCLKARGLKVPDDVSVVGFDDFIYPGLCDVEITTYSVNMEAMAEVGLDMVQAKMNGRKYRKGMNMVEGQIVLKESVKRIV